MQKIEIYNDSLHEGLWFKNLSPNLLKNAKLVSINKRGQNPKIIDELISYDRPDIILVVNDAPKLILEKTTEVPTGHNIGQRVGRIVKAAENQVPAITFLPFDALKHGKYSSLCNLNIRLLDAFIKMSIIHDIPIIAMNWKSDKDGELIRDDSQDIELSKLINDFISNEFNPNIDEFKKQLNYMNEEFTERLSKNKLYGFPPKSVEIINTSKFLSKYSDKLAHFKDNISKNKSTLIYTMDMKPDKCRREDPYTGMQFVYDYQHCRIGVKPEQKKMNLVLHIPRVDIKLWKKNNPNDNSRKSCLWYKTANLILLKDGIIYLR
ncbi:MAG: hypothetical protein CMG76_02655 [Candidatus Marinimicrobia bacterium]|nr:hypothetical protein [Candidatus Neomarinimicrobiota bacterium]|tara:strand:+ start:779 stop:1741 length:963 start_codon:yes stop_codon:yes gene_type:complete